MKKHLAVLAATAVLGVTSAFAANPFADVTPQDWAYQAVAQLASQGVVNGYPDGTFKGQNNITRFEMAQMVAKAMARQGQVDAEQNAIINRLANEFSTELNNLGVRVSTLENKVGNFAFTGDARVRYTGTDDARKSKFDYRARVQFDATVNDNTKAVVRLATDDKVFGESGNPKTSIDNVYVQHNFGKYATATMGRQDFVIGNGLVFDDVFEGAVATVGKDNLNATATYGFLNGDTTPVSYYQVNYKPVENVAVKGYVLDLHKTAYPSIHGATLDVNFGGHNKVWAGGEYAKVEGQGAAGEAWIAGLGYGEADTEKVGTWGVKAHYYDAKAESPVAVPTCDLIGQKHKGFFATVDYTVAKNVGLSAFATINTKELDTTKNEYKTAPESYRAELNYKF